MSLSPSLLVCLPLCLPLSVCLVSSVVCACPALGFLSFPFLADLRWLPFPQTAWIFSRKILICFFFPAATTGWSVGSRAVAAACLRGRGAGCGPSWSGPGETSTSRALSCAGGAQPPGAPSASTGAGRQPSSTAPSRATRPPPVAPPSMAPLPTRRLRLAGPRGAWLRPEGPSLWPKAPCSRPGTSSLCPTLRGRTERGPLRALGAQWLSWELDPFCAARAAPL